nr:baseplate J/gp47 family protein [uncultured Agrobacterium sp.]
MAWNIRSLDDASAAVRGAFRRYLPGTDTALKNNFVTIVAKVLAALSYEFELRMGWLSKQILLSTSTNLAWIKLHAAEVGIYQRTATAAAGEITGTGAPATTYPSGIRFVSGNVTFVSTMPVTSGTDGSMIVPITAEVKGSVGNRAGAGLLSLADPGLYTTLGASWTVDDDGLGPRPAKWHGRDGQNDLGGVSRCLANFGNNSFQSFNRLNWVDWMEVEPVTKLHEFPVRTGRTVHIYLVAGIKPRLGIAKRHHYNRCFR